MIEVLSLITLGIGVLTGYLLRMSAEAAQQSGSEEDREAHGRTSEEEQLP